MPQRKPIKSLKAACLHNIAKNMGRVWCKDYQENLMGQGGFIYVDGPFNYLPLSLVSDIIDTLKKERLLHRNHLHLLITSGLERLDLSNESVDSVLLNFITFRCKESLKELSLANCSKVSRVALNSMFSVLCNLEVLDMSRTNVHDDELEIIGSNCSKLRKLNVSMTHYVTDKGIKYLFLEETSGDGEQRLGKCKALTHLKIHDTKVSLLGVEAALRQLPNLQHLNNGMMVTVLNNMHWSDWKAGRALPCYHLRSLFGDYRLGNSCPQVALRNNALSVVTDTCPYVTDVNLVAYRYTDNPDDFLSFCKLKNLSVLNVIASDPERERCIKKIDFFSHAFVPVLQACGKSVTIITIGDFPPDVDVGIIGICCPVLQELNLAFNRGYKNSTSNLSSSNVTPFSSLRKLKLVCLPPSNIAFHDLSLPIPDLNAPLLASKDLPPEQMKSLLSSPVLESVFIRESSVITDRLLKDVLSKGQKFLHLRNMELEECHNLTAQFIHSLLSLPGPLRSLKLWQCNKISRSDFSDFKTISRRNRWDLHIDWT